MIDTSVHIGPYLRRHLCGRANQPVRGKGGGEVLMNALYKGLQLWIGGVVGGEGDECGQLSAQLAVIGGDQN